MKPEEEFWDEDNALKDYLFDTNLSLADIAKELGWSQAKLSKRIKQLGLEWVRRKNRKLSRGHAALLDIMQNLLPNENIVVEYHIGERLRLDIYCPSYRLGAEYHGRQHFFYSTLFHNTADDFKESQKRDERKIELCKEQGIALVVFRYNDDLTYDCVFERMLEAIQNAPQIPKQEKKSKFKGNHFYEKMKAKQREYNKQRYREYKNWKKTNGK